MGNLKKELKSLILSSLKITDISLEQLDDDQALIGSGLSIDSIDILQLIVEIERKFGIKLETGRFNRDEWKTISTLAAAIQARMNSAS